MTTRCPWAEKSPQLLIYHDLEWGVPVYNEQQLFENLCLEIFQAGLRWELVLKYRAALKVAFHNFDPRIIAQMTAEEIKAIEVNPRIIRNGAKIQAVVTNGRVLAALHELDWSLGDLLWKRVNETPLDHHLRPGEQPEMTTFVAQLSQTLTMMGFKRIGPKTLYSTMQASGIVNDHLQTCYRHQEVQTIR